MKLPKDDGLSLRINKKIKKALKENKISLQKLLDDAIKANHPEIIKRVKTQEIDIQDMLYRDK